MMNEPSQGFAGPIARWFDVAPHELDYFESYPPPTQLWGNDILPQDVMYA